MIIEFIPEHFYLSHHPDGHRSSPGCHFLPNIHHFHIHPITDIGTGSFVAVTFCPLSAASGLLSSWGCRIRHPATTTGLCSFRNCHIHNIHIHPITTIRTRSFVPVTFVSYQPRRIYCHPEAVTFVTLSLTQDYVHSVMVTFITFTFTPLPTSGQDHLLLSISSPFSRVGSCHSGAVAFVTMSPTTGLCSFRTCHIHHIHFHPITNIGSRSFVVVTFVTYQPRWVYSSWGCRIRHPITSFRTMFIP